MASYTMELNEVLATLLVFDGVDVSVMDTKTLIEEGRKKLFDFEYDIFDTNYKAVWETNFIRNFFMREIGFETEDLFKFQLESWLRINMPYFNKMFQSELLDFDPLVNSDMKTDTTTNKNSDSTLNVSSTSDNTKTNHQKIDGTENQNVNGTDNQTVNGTQNDTTFTRELENNTPDTRLAITTLDGAGVIEYASSITENTGKGSNTTTNDVDRTMTNDIDTTTSNTVDGNNTDKTTLTGETTNNITDVETYVSSRTGKVGAVTYSQMLIEYRQSLVRIENRMFAEMQQLFMLVY
jgi:hypothetical protein